MTREDPLPPHMNWPEQEKREPWPEPLRRIILAVEPHEMPRRDRLNKWEPDAAKADALYAYFIEVLEEKKAEHVACCELIGLPCKDDAEAHFFAMSTIKNEANVDKGRDEGEAEAKAVRAAQAKAAAKKPRNKASPYPAWMKDIAKAKSDNQYHSATDAAKYAQDAIITKASDPSVAVPTLTTLAEWIRQFRRVPAV